MQYQRSIKKGVPTIQPPIVHKEKLGTVRQLINGATWCHFCFLWAISCCLNIRISVTYESINFGARHPAIPAVKEGYNSARHTLIGPVRIACRVQMKKNDWNTRCHFYFLWAISCCLNIRLSVTYESTNFGARHPAIPAVKEGHNSARHTVIGPVWIACRVRMKKNEWNIV